MRHQLDQILGGRALILPPPRRGSTKVPRPTRVSVPGLAGGDVAEQVGDHALRQVVGLDLVGDGQLLQLRHQAPVAADDAPHQPVVAEVVEAALLAVALAGGIDQGQVARRAEAERVVLRRREEALLQGDGDVLGEADADEAAGGDRVAVADQATASRALTILPCSKLCSAASRACRSWSMRTVSPLFAPAIEGGYGNSCGGFARWSLAARRRAAVAATPDPGRRRTQVDVPAVAAAGAGGACYLCVLPPRLRWDDVGSPVHQPATPARA